MRPVTSSRRVVGAGEQPDLAAHRENAESEDAEHNRNGREAHHHRLGSVSAFPDELYQSPRSWAERAYPKLIYYNRLDEGGHFAAWEQPQLFSEEVRAGFRPLRK